MDNRVDVLEAIIEESSPVADYPGDEALMCLGRGLMSAEWFRIYVDQQRLHYISKYVMGLLKYDQKLWTEG